MTKSFLGHGHALTSAKEAVQKLAPSAEPGIQMVKDVKDGFMPHVSTLLVDVGANNFTRQSDRWQKLWLHEGFPEAYHESTTLMPVRKDGKPTNHDIAGLASSVPERDQLDL